MKNPEILPEVFRQTTSCAANRQIAHNLQVGADTIDRAIGRPGRHCLLMHSCLWGQRPPMGPVAIDGLETFEWSQYFPFHINVAVLLEVVAGQTETAVVRSDDHPACRTPIRGSKCRIRHEVTHSTVRRDGDNALFEANLLDGWLRHGSANHKRETIAWSKRRQRAMERMAIVLVDRNCIRSRKKKQGGPTAGMMRGITERKLSVGDILAERLFPGRIVLPPVWDSCYRGLVRTGALKVNREHRLKCAF